MVGNIPWQVGGLAANTAGLSSYVVRALLCNYDGRAQLLHAMTPAQHRAFHDRSQWTNGCENIFSRYLGKLGRKPPAAELASSGPKLMDVNELSRMNPDERVFFMPCVKDCAYIQHDDGEHSAANVLDTWPRGGMGGSCQPHLMPAMPTCCGGTWTALPAASARGDSEGRPTGRPRERVRGRSGACTVTGAASRP